MNYNTTRPHLVLPEHGRHIYDMVMHLKTLEDREERNTAAQAVIKLMGQLNPHLRDVEDFNHKLWDHLFIIAEYDLDVDSPYPIPEREVIEKKPEPLKYPDGKIRYRHYGRGVQDMINKTIELEGEAQEAMTLLVANMMKNYYLRWNRDSVTDDVIWDQLSELSGGKLKRLESFELTDTQDILRTQRPAKKRSNNNSKHKSKKRSR